MTHQLSVAVGRYAYLGNPGYRHSEKASACLAFPVEGEEQDPVSVGANHDPGRNVFNLFGEDP